MIILDMHTVILLNVVIYIICTMLIAQLWRQNSRRFAGIDCWAFGFTLQTVALILIIMRGTISDWISIILANTLIFVGALLIYLGLERFFQKISSQLHNYVLFALFIIAFVYSTFIRPDLHLRILIVSLSLLIISLQGLWLLRRRVDPESRQLTFGVATVFGGYCAVNIVQSIEYFVGTRAGADFFHTGISRTLVLVSYQILFILLTYGLILMVNKRLYIVLRTQEEKFAKAFHSAPYAITLTRLSDGRIIDVNESFTTIAGYERTEVLGKNTIDLRIWEDEADRTSMLESLSRSGKVHGLELRFRKKSGEIATGLFSAEIMQIDGEKHILSSIGDITGLKRAVQEMAIIADIGRLISSTLNIEEVYGRFAAETQKLIPFDRLSVNLTDIRGNAMNVVYVSGLDVPGRRPGDSFPLEGSVSEALMLSRTGIINQPADAEKATGRFPVLGKDIAAGLRSLMSVPLISRDEVIGVLHFRSRKPDVYTAQDLSLAEKIGAQIAGAIASAQLFNDLTKMERSLRESEEEQRLLIETLPLAVFVESQGKIVYVNPAFLTLFKASSPAEVIGMRLIERVPPELYDVVEKRRRIMTEEKCVLPPLEQNLRCMDGTFITVVSTPMPFIFQGQPAILTALYDVTERKRSEIELEKSHKLLQIHSREIEDLQAKLKEQAIRDPLTGLFNRRYLEETMERELARASREGFPIGVVMIDIDRFKQVNDSHGHKAGDLILQAIGKLLLGGIRAGDIACRYGGEEFLLILPQAPRAITAERAEAWRSDFEALRTFYGRDALQATISLGIAAYPEDGVTAEAVIHAADQAMFRAKALGRNRVVLS